MRDCRLYISLPSGRHTEGHPRFSDAHRFGSSPFGSVDDLMTSWAYISARRSSPAMVAIHGIEVELGGIDHEVVIGVLRIGQRFQQSASVIK
ncbi:hypothetical protein V2I01_14205 [Micromonospora sp. BRA006-A]|nr:hypothetical protein [Micromonospora sp. BRA006-A]